MVAHHRSLSIASPMLVAFEIPKIHSRTPTPQCEDLRLTAHSQSGNVVCHDPLFPPRRLFRSKPATSETLVAIAFWAATGRDSKILAASLLWCVDSVAILEKGVGSRKCYVYSCHSFASKKNSIDRPLFTKREERNPVNDGIPIDGSVKHFLQ